LVETNERSIAKEKLLVLIKRYYEKYDLKKYGLKEKINSDEVKKKINTLNKTNLDERDFKQD
jgi:hypothetical protein